MAYFDESGYQVDSFEIIQCWADKSVKGQSHHKHAHPNSYVSGVFYLTSSGGGDIIFHDETFQSLQPAVERETTWNRRSFQIKPEAGQLVLFPSNTVHSTLVNFADQSRYSISFNVMIRGQVGLWDSAAWVNL